MTCFLATCSSRAYGCVKYHLRICYTYIFVYSYSIFKWPSRSSLYARSALALTLKQPPILARLLTFIDWQTLHAVLDTSTQARDLFNDLVLRDIILARLVPGYDACRHPAANLDNLVSIDIHHLHLFLISQTFPVHLYPTHALRSLFSLHPNDSKSEPLASLTQAHSRFTLILQSLVHSSPNFSVPLEPTETSKHYGQPGCRGSPPGIRHLLALGVSTMSLL
ncbi:hypothetical protein FPV67DRAFT_893149 [Lyophyllum atratum]|nr:hypothetical protein FPV67DRAFT_893149 [Lyophyllum atratum]